MSVVGAERLRPDFAAAFKEKFGLDMLEGYGATEMGPVVSVNVPNVMEGWREPDRAQAGHGRASVPGVAARIVDPETAGRSAERARKVCCS